MTKIMTWSGTQWVAAGAAVPPTAKIVALIGDSTLFQDGNGEAALRAALAPTFGTVFFYAVISKAISYADTNGFNTLTNMTQARAALGREPDVWLFNLGSNGHHDGDTLNVNWINAVMSNTSSTVVWNGISQANGYSSGASTEATRLHWNDIAKPVVLSYPNGIWADWHAYVKAKPGGDASMWSPDGVHNTTAGYAYKNAFNVANLNAARTTVVTPPVDVPPNDLGLIAKVAGAPALSSLSYTQPTVNVRYISPSGNDANSGTLASPMATLAAAANAVKSSGTVSNPGTVVMRAGSYPLDNYQPGNGYFLRFQSYPGEEAWIDGSVEFTGSWTNSGSTWSTNYTAPSIPSIGNDAIQDDPNALLPDMCFLDGVSLYQAADGATPSASQFSVNRGTNKLTIGTNPSGREVRYSAIQTVMLSGSRIDLLGIGIRRYRCAGGTLNAGLYYGGTSAGTIIENCRFEQMGRNVLSLNKSDCRITTSSFSKIGQSAVLGDKCDNLLIDRSRFLETNTGKWRPQPTSGSIKITAARGTEVRHNFLKYCHNGIQLWYDVSCTQVEAYGNHIDGTSIDGSVYADTGINFEESEGGYFSGVQYESIIAGNTVINCGVPIGVIAAGGVIVANNTISGKKASGNAQGITCWQDRDDNHGIQVPIANCHWWDRNIRIVNNRIMPQSGGWQFLAYDSQGEMPRPRALAAGLGNASAQQVGGLMLTQLAGNWFAPATGSSGSGSIMASIGRADGTRANYNTPGALNVTDSAYGLGSNIGTNYQSATEPTGVDHNTAVPMVASVATLLGVPTGTKRVGNPLPMPVEPTGGTPVIPGGGTPPASYPFPTYTDRNVYSYASLYQPGDSLSTVLNTRLAAVGGGYVTLPNGFDEEIVDFLQGGNSYGLYAPSCYGLWGNGPDQARIKVRAGASTKAGSVPSQAGKGINPLHAMRISPSNSANPVQVHMYGLTLEGGDVGHTYNGLHININAAGSTYEWMRLKGFGLGDWNSPPGETNMCNVYNGGGVTLRGIEADGFLSNGVRAGGAFATNGPTSCIYEDVFVHDTLVSGVTFGTGGDIFTGTLSRNIVTTRLKAWNNANHSTNPGAKFSCINHEGVDNVSHYYPDMKLISSSSFQSAHVTINNSQKSSKLLIHEPEWNGMAAPWAYGCLSVSVASDYPSQKQLMSDITVIKNGIPMIPKTRAQASTANPVTDYILLDEQV